MQAKDVKFIVIDLFCGFGGTTLGYHKSKKAIVIACVNHDHKAIMSHWSNHPEVEHFNEDITKLYGRVMNGFLLMSPEMKRLVRMVDIYRAMYPNAKVVLWASLECTNHSKAKGGMSRDAESRTLAQHLDRYIFAIEPDYIKIENVVEFKIWGPLEVSVKKTPEGYLHCPIEWKKEEIETIVSMEVDFYGDLIIKKKKQKVSLPYPVWVPEKNTKSIYFNNWLKHVDSIGYKNQWKEMNAADFGAYTSRERLFGCFAKTYLPIKWPNATHSEYKKRKTLDLFSSQLKPWLPVKHVLDLHNEGDSIFGRKKPLCDKTLDRIYSGLIKFVAGSMSNYIEKYRSVYPEDEYLDVITTKFLSPYYKTSTPSHLDGPCPVIPTKDRFNLGSVHQFIKRDFSNGGESCDINKPAGAVLSTPKMDLVTVKPFIMDTAFNNNGSDIESPLGVITANRKHHYIVNPSYWGNSSSVEEPSPVIIARQDKSPLYLACVKEGYFAIRIDESDTPSMVRVKKFMAIYGIYDIKIRMLFIKELLRIQGFPEDYKMVGTQTDAKKFIGNAVHPIVPEKWVHAFDEVI